MAELIRPRSGRVIAGVCVAIANRFDMSVTIVRALMVIAVLFFGLSHLALPDPLAADPARSPLI